MTLQQFIKDYGVFSVFIGQIAYAGIAWWRGKEIPTRADLSRLGSAIGEVRSEVGRVETTFDRRCRDIEHEAKGGPSRQDIHRLSLEMERVRGDIRVFTAEVTGAKNTVTAQVEAVEAQVTASRDLVVRLESMVGTITQHLLSANR